LQVLGLSFVDRNSAAAAAYNDPDGRSMTVESVTWFAAQGIIAGGMIPLGRRLARARAAVWKSAATLATVVALLWPLMRWYPAHALALVGTPVMIYIEVTGMIPAVLLLFTIASVHVRRLSERRLSILLVVVCGLYFVRCGLWMVRLPLPDLGATSVRDGVCLQSTPYTCVAASLVTLLRAHGVDATETEMARLSDTEAGGGATDTRAVRALERKLAGRPFDIRYEAMDYERLRQIRMPCVVSTKFGYFVSHMVPVLAADENEVTLGDPLTGRRTMPVDGFRNIWHKRGIWLRPAQPAIPEEHRD
jgi:hypothetical protein